MVSIAHLALDAYRTWRADHPLENDSAYPGYNPGGSVSKTYGGSFSRSGKFERASDDEFDTAYTDYTSTLPASSIDNAGGYIVYPRLSSFASSHDYVEPGVISSIDDTSVMVSWSRTQGTFNFIFTFEDVSPVTGNLSIVSGPSYYMVTTIKGAYKQGSLTDNNPSFNSNGVAGGNSFRVISRIAMGNFGDGIMCLASQTFSVTISLPCVRITPFPAAVNVQSTATNDTYNVYSRPASITGNYGIITSSGDVQKIDNQTIVNETDNSVYNPVTNTNTNIR